MIRPALALSLCLAAASCTHEVPRPPSAADTCFGLSTANEYCEAQACFPKHADFTAKDGTSPGFECSYVSGDSCPAEPPTSTGFTVWLDITTDAGRVSLTFDDRILVDGYSLESFRKYLTSANVFGSFDSTDAQLEGSFVAEIVSYESGVLRVRGAGDAAAGSSHPTDVAPHACFDPTWGTTYLCTKTDCQYGAGAGGVTGSPVQFTVDVQGKVPPRGA
jgi:hypothetical protein